MPASQGVAPPSKSMPGWAVALVAFAAAAIGAAAMYLFNKRQQPRTPKVLAGTDMTTTLNDTPLSSSAPEYVAPEVAGQQGDLPTLAVATAAAPPSEL